MSFAENLVKERIESTPENYAKRVSIIAGIYFILNIVSLIIFILIVWRGQFFVTLAQRSNVETATLAIILVLSVYYIATTFKGFVGAIRMVFLNIGAGTSDEKKREEIEKRKQDALKAKGESKYACFDKMVMAKDKPDEPISWDLGDSYGKLAVLTIDGVKVKLQPMKDGLHNSIFEYVADQIQSVVQKHDPDAELNITEWSAIDDDGASSYNSMVTAFRNLEKQLGNKGQLWPCYELSQEEIDEVGKELRLIVPTLRNEALLPAVDYEVEYTVPIIPEPLAFMQLSRHDNRADPIITMGCAGIAMLIVMLLLTLMIVLPPWLPSK